MKKYSVAVVGLGMVGKSMLKVIRDRKFPAKDIQVLATRDRTENVDGVDYKVRKTTAEAFDGDQLPRLDGREVDDACRPEACREIDGVDRATCRQEVSRRVHVRAAMGVEFEPFRVPALDFEGLCLVDLDAPHGGLERQRQVRDSSHRSVAPATAAICVS